MEKEKLTALVQKAQAGDPEAMEELLRTAHTSVSYQCRKLLRDPRNAEDTTQEVLLTVYTKLGSLKNPATFWGWLNTTTANRCMDVLRRGNVEFQFAEDEEGRSVLDGLEELDEQSVPDKSLDNAETVRMIEEIVNGLPEAQRICVLMYYYDEMSVKDIAAALGVPENTVKSRLNYARKAVKEQVLDYEKKGVKLYGLSPLPFMLYFLLRAAEETADSAAADAMAKRAVELGASALPGAASTGGTAAAGGYAALVDIGEGNPILVLACGSDHGEFRRAPESPPTSLHSFFGKLEVWQYIDGQVQMSAAAHEVYWKEDAYFVCHTRVGGTMDENGNVFPMEAQSHYLDFSEDVYSVEGGVLSQAPIASASVEIDLRGDTAAAGGVIDGQPVGDAVWPAWRQQWAEGGHKSIVISQQGANWEQYWVNDGWTAISIGYDVSIGGYVDQGFLDVQTVSPGADTAGVLRQCAGE